MARFAGEVGYGEPTKVAPGVTEDVITEVLYYGDIIRLSTNPDNQDEKILPDISANNAISILADERAIKHFSQIKYVRWNGVRWTVTSVEVKRPRLILNIGKVYNGPTPTAPEPT